MAGIYTFGTFGLDTGLRQLSRHGAAVHLEPKPFDLLCYLIEHRHRVVTKRELLEQLWPGVFVSEAALTSAMRDLRRRLGAEHRERLIETRRGCGYRFAADVCTGGVGAPEAPTAGVRADGGFPIVGRNAELRVLGGAVDAVVHGRGGGVLIRGDAGSGKTRLLEESCLLARARGARVLVGSAFPRGGAPPFWPWIQILRQLSEPVVPATPRDVSRRSDLARLLLELRAGRRPPHDAAERSPALVRFDLVERIADLLRDAARVDPLVLALDDLHWADESSLLLLEFLAGFGAGERILLFGAYRDAPFDRSQTLGSTLGDLARRPGVRWLELGELEGSDVAKILEWATGTRPSRALVDRLVRSTGGNAFFVDRFARSVRLWVRDGGAAGDRLPGVPEGVRAAIRQRIAALPRDTRETLETASAIGYGFPLSVLRRVSKLPAEQLHEQISVSLDVRLLRAEAPLGYAFAHGVVRDTLYDDLGERRRIHLQRRIGDALEAPPG